MNTIRKFYTYIVTIYLFSVLWVMLNILNTQNHTVLSCPFKSVTGIPCPACGLTTGTVSIIRGEIIQGLAAHPLSIIVLGILIVLPVFLLVDYFRKKTTVYNFHNRFQNLFRKKIFAAIGLTILLIIWFYNIIKS